MTSGPRRVLFVATAVYGLEGGLERFNRRVVRALAEMSGGGRIGPPCVVALGDAPSDAAGAPREVRFVAARSRKVRAALAFGARLMIDRPALVLYGHIGFAPLVVLGRILRPRSGHLLIVHGVEVWRPPTRLRRWVARRLVDRVVAVSRFTAGRMGSFFGLSEDRFLRLPNAVDVSGDGRAGPEGASPALAGRHRLLTVSRLSPADAYKNVDKVIRALPEILAEFPETHYYVVGDGPSRGRLEGIAREAGVEAKVHFLGHVDDATRDAVYAASHVFVLPSTGEGFGIVFLEAWKHALPLVASDQDAARELIREGVDGLCVAPEPSAVAAAVRGLLADPERRARMGAEGRRRLEREFTHEQFRRALGEIVDRFAPCAA
jgi:glycosyltransferase involved in cell wall biosynthesis